jgi:catechol O-methyltransferase
MMTFKPAKLEASRRVLEKLPSPPKVLFELGTYVGNSAVAWGAMLKELNGGKTDGVKVYCMELDPDCAKIATDLVKLAGVDDVVEVVLGQSGDTIKKLKESGAVDKIDVLFLDHWEKFYLPDLQLCEDLGLFNVGSVVLADNTDMPGAPEYLKYVRAGGRGTEGSVKFKTESLKTAEAPGRPNIVEATTVVSI